MGSKMRSLTKFPATLALAISLLIQDTLANPLKKKAKPLIGRAEVDAKVDNESEVSFQPPENGQKSYDNEEQRNAGEAKVDDIGKIVLEKLIGCLKNIANTLGEESLRDLVPEPLPIDEPATAPRGITDAEEDEGTGAEEEAVRRRR